LLTFEEFSAKKKIDLALFQQAEPDLYSEFKSEYDQMGEKSFDHSKKFLFNKIRRAYHIKEEPKTEKPVIELTEIASQALPLDSPAIDQKPAYTPRFKPRVMPQPASVKDDQELKAEAEQKPKEKKADALPEKPAYKPRFNMKNIKPPPEEE
jgi:hypothetical protein